MNVKSKMRERQAGRAVSKSQSVRKPLRKIETERSECSSSETVWKVGHYSVYRLIHYFTRSTIYPPFRSFTCIFFFSFQTYPSPTMNYATQMNYKLKKELNDLQYGRRSSAVMLRSVLCLLCRVI